METVIADIEKEIHEIEQEIRLGEDALESLDNKVCFYKALLKMLHELRKRAESEM